MLKTFKKTTILVALGLFLAGVLFTGCEPVNVNETGDPMQQQEQPIQNP